MKLANRKLIDHSVNWGINPPLKNTTLIFFAKPPFKSANCLSPPFLGNPPIYWFSFEPPSPPPPLKIEFCNKPP